MKKAFYIILLFVLVACEDKYEDTHKFSSSYKYQIIKLDASKVLVDIQVKPATNPGAAFKIVFNNQYVFVGEMMKGVHVYEKTDSRHANPLCFIECKYLKAFEIKDNLLYCNNFVDLLIIDIENPAQARILSRRGGHFNYYLSNYYNYRNQLIPFDGYTFELTTITEQLPKAETFYDQAELYESIIVDKIPETLNFDRPYVGFARVDDIIYTYDYNYTYGYTSLVTCDYKSGYISTTPSIVGNYHYTSIDLRYEDKILYIFGSGFINYFDSDHILTQKKNYQAISNAKNVSYMESQRAFWILSNNNTISGAVSLDGQNYPKSTNAPDVSGMLCIGNNLITLGKTLEVYNAYPLSEPLTVVKQYPDISGLCMAKDGGAMIVVNKQGISFYDISDLENIKLIP